jgi:hypothetical protein
MMLWEELLKEVEIEKCSHRELERITDRILLEDKKRNGGEIEYPYLTYHQLQRRKRKEIYFDRVEKIEILQDLNCMYKRSRGDWR